MVSANDNHLNSADTEVSDSYRLLENKNAEVNAICPSIPAPHPIRLRLSVERTHDALFLPPPNVNPTPRHVNIAPE
jgi:hypothetical protein